MKFLVCNKYELNIDDNLIGDYKRVNGSVEAIPYSNELMRGNDVAYENWCYEYLMQFLPTNSTVVEWMGGVGCTGLIIQNTIKPWRHVIYELSADLCKHLKQLFPNCHIIHGNAYKTDPEYGSTIHCVDNNTWTAKRVKQSDSDVMMFVRNVFENSDYVLFTDTACCIFYPHRQYYANILGVSGIVDLADYYDALSHWMDNRYGQRIIALAKHRKAAYLLFSRNGATYSDIVNAPTNARNYLQKIGHS